MQGMKIDPLTCKIDFKQQSGISIWSNLASQTTHMTAQLSQPPISPAPAKQRCRSDVSISDLHALFAASPIARVEIQDERNIGYCCHPAVTDSSMHIGILAGPADGKMRIPGQLLPTSISLQEFAATTQNQSLPSLTRRVCLARLPCTNQRQGSLGPPLVHSN